MKFITLGNEDLYQLLDEKHNPPVIRNQKEENLFQMQMRTLYGELVESLSAFGQEGDRFGVSDFAVRPDLRKRPTIVAPPAPHLREFTITVLTQKFHQSDYLEVLHGFLVTEAPEFRIIVDQDFDPLWAQTIFITAGMVRVFCTNLEELSRLRRIFAAL